MIGLDVDLFHLNLIFLPCQLIYLLFCIFSDLSIKYRIPSTSDRLQHGTCTRKSYMITFWTYSLQHIIVRGIERRRIFSDDQDRNNFIERLGDIVSETQTFWFSSALIPNHILLRTGQTSLATIMRRLLNGYAVSYSRRHRRHGELSISCLVADPPLGYDIDKLTLRVSSDLGVDPEQVWSYGKHPATVSFANLKLPPQ